ncbi:unnamed protein product [Musa hybrid cultivar]
MVFSILLLLVVIKFMNGVNSKAHKHPFDISLSKCKFSLELIHSDLMDSTQTLSYLCSRYMLISIDDFTRFTWVYFMKKLIFLILRVQVNGSKFFQRKIKRLHTDVGEEFSSD